MKKKICINSFVLIFILISSVSARELIKNGEFDNSFTGWTDWKQSETITYDNGLEFCGHLEVNQALKAQSYFCKPYHSWEKGGVENYNGLVRQYLPKGTSFTNLTAERLKDTFRRWSL